MAWLLTMLWLLTWPAGSTEVRFHLLALTGSPANRQITITPTNAPGWTISGTNAIVLSQPITLQAVNGAAQTNLVPGVYRLTFSGLPGSILIAVPETNQVLYAHDLAIGGLRVYHHELPQPWSVAGGDGITVSVGTNAYIVSVDDSVARTPGDETFAGTVTAGTFVATNQIRGRKVIIENGAASDVWQLAPAGWTNLSTGSGHWDFSRMNQLHVLSPQDGLAVDGRLSVSGTLEAGSFVGVGAGLTSLNASAITSGTLSEARLPDSAARTNRAQTFYGDLTVRTNLNVLNTIQADGIRFQTNVIRIGTVSVPALGTANYNEAVVLGRNAAPSSGSANEAVIIGYLAGQSATNSGRAVILGSGAGNTATNATLAVLGGYFAGSDEDAQESVMLGYLAGRNARVTPYSVFLGSMTARFATNAMNAVAIGNAALNSAFLASNAVAVGWNAGWRAGYATNSVFLGRSAGALATNSHHSIFLGSLAGNNVEDSAHNIVIGGIQSDPTNRQWRLMLDASNTTIPLLYGEFDNRLLRVHGWLHVTNKIVSPYFEGNAAGLTNLPVSGIAASGTRDNTTFLRGDGQWAVPPGGGGGGGGTTEYVATANTNHITVTTNGTLYTLDLGHAAARTNRSQTFYHTNNFMSTVHLGPTIVTANQWRSTDDFAWHFDGETQFTFNRDTAVLWDGYTIMPYNLQVDGNLEFNQSSGNFMELNTVAAVNAFFTNIVAGVYSVVNVKDYGAKGDGVTDDWPVLIDLLASTNPAANPVGQYRIVYFPPGNYVIRSNLIWPTGTILVGASANENTYIKRGSSIRPATNWTGTALIDSQTWHEGEFHHKSAIRDLLLDGRVIGQIEPVVDHGIRVFQAGEICTIENVSIRSFRKAGIWAAGTHAALNIERVSIHNCGDYSIALTGGTDWDKGYGMGTNWSGAGTVIIQNLSSDRAREAILGINANHFVTVIGAKIEQISSPTNNPHNWPWQAGRWIVRYTTNAIYGAQSIAPHNAVVSWIGGHVNHDHNNQGLQTTNAAFFTSDQWRPRFMLSGARVYGSWSGTNYLWVWTPDRQHPRVDWDEAPTVWHRMTNYHGTFVASRFFGDAVGLTNLPVTGIAAGGTADNTTFLRGDGVWAAPPGGSGGGISNPPAPGLMIASHDTNQWAWHVGAIAPGTEVISMWAQPPNSGTSPANSPGTSFIQDGAVALTTTNASGTRTAGNILFRTNSAGVTTRLRYGGNIAPAYAPIERVYHVLALDHPGDVNAYVGWVSNNPGGQTDWPGTTLTYALWYSTNATWNVFVRKSSTEATHINVGASVVAGKPYRLSIIKHLNGDLGFYLDNRLMATVPADQAPPAADPVWAMVWVYTKATTTQDWRWYKTQFDYMPD